jgi:acetyl-CoA carboxylase carboxyltransferase component
MAQRLVELEERRNRARAMGGEERVRKQHERGKLSCRERLARFFDGGKYFEIGLHGTQMGGSDDRPPADAVVVGYGEVNGRMVGAAAYDFTVKGGSIGPTGEVKVTRLRDLCLKWRMPIVWFVDSAGARIDPAGAGQDFISTFAGTGYLFREQVVMSGVVPQVAAMVGPGAAGTAYIPGLADFVPIVKGIGSMALAGPLLVKAVTGEEISEQDLGGSRIHSEVSGVGDLEVENDDACIAAIKDYLSYFPQSSGERPPIAECTDPVDRREESLATLLPDSTRRAYDMYKVIRAIADDSKFFDLKPRWARNMITCLARFGGRPCGIVANNPMHLGGVLDINAADKAAHFVQLCDAFNLPILFLHDTPGFMVGSKVEAEGIIRHGAKMLHAVASATVPKLSVTVRKSYGAGYYVMNGRAYEPDLFVAWPTAEISVMGAEGMLGIAGKKIAGGAEMPPEMKAQMVKFIQDQIDIFRTAGWGLCDDVIDPRETRAVICHALKAAWGKTVERPARKRGIIPV